MTYDNNIYDFIVVGSGPSSVSAAWPLVKSGKRVLMIDAGKDEILPNAVNDPLSLKDLRNGTHSHFFQGVNLSKLFNQEFSSPKIRISGENFSEYLKLNKLEANNFSLTGLIGAGGLSRIWGAACSCYDDDDLFESEIKLKDLLPSYIKVANRIGMTGNNSSSIAKFIGDQLPLQGSLELTPLMKKLISSYGDKSFKNFLMGETLTAVIGRNIDSRGACTGEMRCMWGCPNEAIYSAKQEIRQLLSFDNFEFRQNIVVDDLIQNKTGQWDVRGIERTSSGRKYFSGNKILLGMGIFGTTRLVMEKFLPKGKSLRVLHNPSFSGAMVIPGFIGRQLPPKGYGGSQLCFRIQLSGGKQEYAFGLIFDAASLPAYDLMRHMPFTRYGAINITRALIPGLFILMVYMPSRLSDSHVKLEPDNKLKINGDYDLNFKNSYSESVRHIKSAFYKLGAYSLPGSFKAYMPGAEVHYGCTLSSAGVISKNGELKMAKGIYVIDGSSLPVLTAKSHTLTIMANADRIACGLV